MLYANKPRNKHMNSQHPICEELEGLQRLLYWYIVNQIKLNITKYRAKYIQFQENYKHKQLQN